MTKMNKFRILLLLLVQVVPVVVKNKIKKCLSKSQHKYNTAPMPQELGLRRIECSPKQILQRHNLLEPARILVTFNAIRGHQH